MQENDSEMSSCRQTNKALLKHHPQLSFFLLLLILRKKKNLKTVDGVFSGRQNSPVPHVLEQNFPTAAEQETCTYTLRTWMGDGCSSLEV